MPGDAKFALKIKMRPAILLFVFGMLLACVSCTSDLDSSSLSERDFGTVLNGSTVEGTFEIFNDRDTPITIKSVSSTCGCVSSVIGDSVVSPRSKGYIDFKWKVTGSPAAVLNKKIMISFKGVADIQTFHLRAKVSNSRAPIFMPAVLHFGNVHRGDQLKKVVRVRAPIASPESFPEEIAVSFQASPTILRVLNDRKDGEEVVLPIIVSIAVPQDASSGKQCRIVKLAGYSAGGTGAYSIELPVYFTVIK